MAVDSRFSEISEFFDELFVDNNPSMLNSNPYPDIPEDFPVDDLVVDLSSQYVTFPSNGLGHVGLNPQPPVSVALGQELAFPSTRGSRLDAVFSDPAMSLNSGLSPGAESLSSSDDSNDSSDAVFKYINQMLMEEDLEEKPWFVSDQLALQNTEKSLYDALGQKYPHLPNQGLEIDVSRLLDSPRSIFSGSGSNDRTSWATATSVSSSNSVDPNIVNIHGDLDHSGPNASYCGDKTVPKDVEVPPNSIDRVVGNGDGLSRSDLTETLVTNVFTDSDSILQFKKGLEEASKFLPSSSQLFENLDNHNFVPEIQNKNSVAHDHGLKAWRTHERDDQWIEEGRATKQTAVVVDEGELSEVFDRVLLCQPEECSDESPQETDSSKNSQPQGRRRTSKGSKSHAKKQSNKHTVDLQTLLILCAQAVSAHDLRTASELLKQIRENSSPQGDGSHRMAHYFANALEARMAGIGGQTAGFFTSPTFKKTSAAEMLKAFHAHLTACPFLKFPIFFAGYMISQRAANAKALHIIDFGIGFGFHWPILIQKLSERPNGPPKLRITGIELPVPGFRPAQRIEDTCRRLAKYCERFGVPFEYAAIPSADWSSIKIEDLKIRSDEMIAVSTLNRLKNLLDETVEDSSPREAVLDLIKRIKPDIFVHSIVCGSYTAPFFVTRFRELLFHLSAVFDMFDATLPGNSLEREVIERELLGREVMNVVACEGAERIERPETHKQWHVRHLRAGFKPLPLDQELMTKMNSKIHQWYHKDFNLDEDKDWMLLGWRGRTMYASACWVPS